ncbi:sensor domain-containing diguanylate cyclase [Zongyangia hominis]|uniref:sensor domain-containing diguanylate cyclase n=1 Tax=Zongyangia hominis TaxID=2763677 RepID=UPI0021CCCD0E|nr:sensor domain-containing diguanylate cyclase [Zongyangia hominis]
MRTNFLVCTVIIIGFVITAWIGYQSNQGIFREDMERVSTLTSEGIYHQIDSIFTKPINISLTMANDSLLKSFLLGEQQHLEDQEFIDTMRVYLNAYREKYSYDSVFLASVQTKRYYYFNGLDRTLEEGDPENGWFYDFLAGEEEYNIVIDNDQVEGAGNEVTVFINCRIRDEEGATIGIVGVGFRVNTLQALLQSYEEHSGVKAYLVDKAGDVEIATDRTGFEGTVNLFDICSFSQLKNEILTVQDQPQYLWYDGQMGSGFVVSRYVDNLGWHLIVENDATALNQKLAKQLLREVLIVIGTILLVLVTITSVIRRYNRRIIELTVAQEQAHQSIFQKATEQLYENIYEIDISHNRAASEATQAYFESLGAPSNIPYDEALQVIAQKQIKEEHRQGYLDTFSSKNVLQSFAEGRDHLRYDFMITNDGAAYYWMRITTQIFYWSEDDSVRMMVYRQNIDAEKRRELYMYEQMQKDSLTGLYNKVATQEHIREMLDRHPHTSFAFFILDIDNFKEANDNLGHAAGDEVLISFAKTLQSQFRKEDVIGRIGGDEFIAFMSVPNRETAEEKARLLSSVLCREVNTEAGAWHVSTSIGVALVPESGRDFERCTARPTTPSTRLKNRGKTDIPSLLPTNRKISGDMADIARFCMKCITQVK